MTEKKKYVTVKEYAAKHNVSVKTVYNRIEKEKIPKSKVKKILNTTLIEVY